MIDIRKISPDDAPALLSMIDALADYEHMDPPNAEAKKRLIRDLFLETPRVESYIAFMDGVPAGYTFIYETYSTFLALPTLFLEDLFVLPEYRSKKVGSALFLAMMRQAHDRGCGRMEWSVLTWNQLAIDFYERYGARQLSDWHGYRLLRGEMEQILQPAL